MGHDQLFKQLFEVFFGDLMQLLLPQICDRLDVEGAEFLRGEHFTDVPDGDRREVDLLAKVPARSDPEHGSSKPNSEASPELILVHLEVEAQARPGMDRRLRRYVQQIQLRHDLPVIPCVVYLRGGQPDVTSHVLREVVFGLELSRFRYFAFGLSPSKARKYLQREEPLAWALAGLMHRGALRPAQHKLACLKRIARSDTDPARRFLLVNCVETYIDLADADEKELETMIAETQNRDALAERLTWAEKMELKGMKQGLLRQLQQKFGPIPATIQSRLEEIEDPRRMHSLFDRILSAESLEEMGLS